MILGRELEETLAALSAVMASAQEDWWLIGSAAVALHGADPGKIADVDVVLSEADAWVILPQLGLPVQGGPGHHQFASHIFATWRAAPLPVELMAGLRQCIDGAWHAVQPQTRVGKWGEGWQVFVPEREELAAILRSFGRPKDLARLAALTALP
ncbi:hypothetical protein WAB17_09730 [Parerythrobacter aurantius]|uniref:hypothetical protein n=1 Tax=Parerythrobacter aurantius TaxID=3127706 RepID=UPI00324BDD07